MTHDEDTRPTTDQHDDADEDTDDGKDLGQRGLADQAKGKLDELAGNAQRKLGEVTGNDDQQADGAARATEGKAQQGIGSVERTADDLLDR